MGTGVFFYNNGKAMVNMTVQLDGTVTTRAGAECDPVDPWALVRTQRAVVQAIADSGKRTRLDVVIATGLPLVDKGRNAPVTLAALLIRAGHDTVIEAMEALYAAFIEEELAA
jgi:hypothetical protein